MAKQTFPRAVPGPQRRQRPRRTGGFWRQSVGGMATAALLGALLVAAVATVVLVGGGWR